MVYFDSAYVAKFYLAEPESGRGRSGSGTCWAMQTASSNRSGTLLVPLVILLVSGGRFLFGWAKPVPVNYSALRKPRQHMAWVAAAGPGANLAMGLGWALLLKLGMVLPESGYQEPMVRMSEAGVRVNLIFMFLNLLPILPLDGGPILASLLPNRMSWQYA